MKTRSLLLLPLLALCACGVPRIVPHAYVAPSKVETPIEVCWLETGGTQAAGGFGAAGWVKADVWEATTSVLLVRHPKGTVLIDTGLSPAPDTEAQELSAWGRFVFRLTAGQNEARGSLPALLARLNVEKIDGAILSHAHADHAGGVSLLPGVPIWLAPEEQRWVSETLESHGSDVMPAQGRAMLAQASPITFAARPYASYDASWDVFEDGTLVVVPTPGHTPGSVATFVDLGGRRLMHVGDLINLQESVDRAVPKSALMRAFTDDDEAATGRQVARLVELHQQDPALWILPAHDRAAYEAFFGEFPAGLHEPRCVTR